MATIARVVDARRAKAHSDCDRMASIAVGLGPVCRSYRMWCSGVACRSVKVTSGCAETRSVCSGRNDVSETRELFAECDGVEMRCQPTALKVFLL